MSYFVYVVKGIFFMKGVINRLRLGEFSAGQKTTMKLIIKHDRNICEGPCAFGCDVVSRKSRIDGDFVEIYRNI